MHLLSDSPRRAWRRVAVGGAAPSARRPRLARPWAAGNRGFTLVELLVVITIIGILVALLLPAVQMARESGRQAQCSNTLKQLALACLQHEQSHGFFPTGGWGWAYNGDPDRGADISQCGGWLYNILPFMDQQAYHDLGAGQTAAQKMTTFQTRVQTPLSGINCPTRRPAGLYPFTSDPPANYTTPTSAGVIKTDYGGNNGTTNCLPGALGIWPSAFTNGDGGPQPTAMPTAGTLSQTAATLAAGSSAPNGIIYPLSRVAAAMVKDGMSNTYLVGEKYLEPQEYLTGTDSGDNEDALIGDNSDVSRGVYSPPLPDTPGYIAYVIFGSAHLNTFQAAMCDGSVHPISYSISPSIHTLLGNRQDGQPINWSTF